MDSAVGCRSREAPDGTSSRPKTLARSRVARLRVARSRVEGEKGLLCLLTGDLFDQPVRLPRLQPIEMIGAGGGT